MIKENDDRVKWLTQKLDWHSENGTGGYKVKILDPV
jgi:hypothetical protein